MIKNLFKIIFFALFTFFLAQPILASQNSFVSVVNPIRGNDFWEQKDQKIETAVLGENEILKKYKVPATYLFRYDALLDKNLADKLNNSPDEKGLFLEVTPSWTKASGVDYHKGETWHSAASAFLTGYEFKQREQLLDSAFEKFKSIFGVYPKSVGAWWVDAYSLDYMQKKYGVITALIVADQYTTDNYQIWGQYFSTPYYPAKTNALHPAQTLENKIPLVIQQWAIRDPVNSYGNGVDESTYSVQANDYIDYHNLDTSYFSKLIDIYTKQPLGKFSQIVVGLENSYDWVKYSREYENQIKALANKRASGQISLVTMQGFASWYQRAYPNLSPEQIIVADDPLGTFRKGVWFMSPYYRAGWFFNNDGSVFRDIRQYVDGEEELCFKTRCDSVNFATSATRVLDDVSFGHKWVIDQGRISDFKVEKKGEEFVLSYKNEAGNFRQIGFLPRDLSIDGKVLSIDTAILSATKKENSPLKNSAVSDNFLKWSFVSVVQKIFEFLIFLSLVIVLPGFVLTHRAFKKDAPAFLRIFISAAVGFVVLTLLFYITSLLRIRFLVFVYILMNLIIFLHLKLYSNIKINLLNFKEPLNLILLVIIPAGTVFQIIPIFKSGLTFSYGLGFWGPNAHDGVWHIALINELIKSVPPVNPIYSGVILKNYHFFYDLLVAATNYLSAVPVADLIFRFYPIMFSLMLGIGSYYLIMELFQSKIASLFSLYLIYFAGSFGWIVEYLREKHFGGESAFWANQAVSFNLNPPFAISLVIIIALFHIIFNLSNFSRLRNIILAILLAGSLIGFKSYGAILVLAALLFVGLIKRQLYFLIIFIGALLVSVLIFLPNFDITSNLLVFVPFWFIHSMIDSPDRAGCVRLSLAREAGFTTHNWFKIVGVEVLSLVIFIVGNLGLRVVSLLSLVKIKNIIRDEKFLLLFILSFLAFLIPILFIQSGNPWNTIQFSYYGLYIAALASGSVLLLVTKLPKYISVLAICIILILAPVNSIVTANSYLGKNPHAFISTKELQGLQFLSNQPDGVILTFPYDEKLKQKLVEPWPILAYDSTAYVSAVSKKAVYLEDESQNQILLTNYKRKLVASKDFFLKSVTKSINFLHDNHIKYIYLPKIFNVRLDESTNIVKNIFENEEVVIYKLNTY